MWNYVIELVYYVICNMFIYVIESEFVVYYEIIRGCVCVDVIEMFEF